MCVFHWQLRSDEHHLKIDGGIRDHWQLVEELQADHFLCTSAPGRTTVSNRVDAYPTYTC